MYPSTFITKLMWMFLFFAYVLKCGAQNITPSREITIKDLGHKLRVCICRHPILNGKKWKNTGEQNENIPRGAHVELLSVTLYESTTIFLEVLKISYDDSIYRAYLRLKWAIIIKQTSRTKENIRRCQYHHRGLHIIVKS